MLVSMLKLGMIDNVIGIEIYLHARTMSLMVTKVAPATSHIQNLKVEIQDLDEVSASHLSMPKYFECIQAT